MAPAKEAGIVRNTVELICWPQTYILSKSEDLKKAETSTNLLALKWNQLISNGDPYCQPCRNQHANIPKSGFLAF